MPAAAYFRNRWRHPALPRQPPPTAARPADGPGCPPPELPLHTIPKLSISSPASAADPDADDAADAHAGLSWRCSSPIPIYSRRPRPDAGRGLRRQPARRAGRHPPRPRPCRCCCWPRRPVPRRQRAILPPLRRRLAPSASPCAARSATTMHRHAEARAGRVDRTHDRRRRMAHHPAGFARRRFNAGHLEARPVRTAGPWPGERAGRPALVALHSQRWYRSARNGATP